MLQLLTTPRLTVHLEPAPLLWHTTQGLVVTAADPGFGTYVGLFILTWTDQNGTFLNFASFHRKKNPTMCLVARFDTATIFQRVGQQPKSWRNGVASTDVCWRYQQLMWRLHNYVASCWLWKYTERCWTWLPTQKQVSLLLWAKPRMASNIIIIVHQLESWIFYARFYPFIFFISTLIYFFHASFRLPSLSSKSCVEWS